VIELWMKAVAKSLYSVGEGHVRSTFRKCSDCISIRMASLGTSRTIPP
jgi:hypothetical protein